MMDRVVRDALYPLGAASSFVGDAIDISAIDEFARVLIGELWYVIVATFGFGAIGIAVLLRRRDDCAWRPEALFVAAVFLGAVLGAMQLAGGATLSASRLDYLAYGRYIDPYVPVLLVAGCAGVLRAGPRLATLAPVCVLVATGVQVLAQGAPKLEGLYQKAAAPAILGLNAVFEPARPFGAGVQFVGIAMLALVVSVVAAALTDAAAGRR